MLTYTLHIQSSCFTMTYFTMQQDPNRNVVFLTSSSWCCLSEFNFRVSIESWSFLFSVKASLNSCSNSEFCWFNLWQFSCSCSTWNGTELFSVKKKLLAWSEWCKTLTKFSLFLILPWMYFHSLVQLPIIWIFSRSQSMYHLSLNYDVILHSG